MYKIIFYYFCSYKPCDFSCLLWIHSPWKTLPLFLVDSFVGFLGGVCVGFQLLVGFGFSCLQLCISSLGVGSRWVVHIHLPLQRRKHSHLSAPRAWFTSCDLCFPHDKISGKVFLHAINPEFWKIPDIRSMAGFCTCWCGTQPVSCALCPVHLLLCAGWHRAPSHF